MSQCYDKVPLWFELYGMSKNYKHNSGCLFWLFYFGCFILAVLFWLFYFGCFILAVLFWLFILKSINTKDKMYNKQELMSVIAKVKVEF